MLVIPLVLMDVAVWTLMSVHWVLTSAPRIVRTPSAPIPVAVELDIDLMLMDAIAMVRIHFGSINNLSLTLYVSQISMSVLSKLTSVPRIVKTLLVPILAAVELGID